MAAAQEASRDFVTLSYGDAVLGLAAPDVLTAARRDGPALLIILQDRVHNDYGMFTNDYIGQNGIVRICGETVGTQRLETSAYFATMTVKGLTEEAVEHWVRTLKSGACAAALSS